MIFTAEQTRLILAGRKTQARRRARLRIEMNGATRMLSLKTAESERLHFTPHRAGNTYPLERIARGDELSPEQRMRSETKTTRAKTPALTIAHFLCTDLRLQRLGDIDIRDARAEGHRTTDEFKIAWVESRDTRWAAINENDDAKLERFDHHADILVWALTLKLVESPRFPKASYSRENYTDIPSRGMRGEMDAPTEDELQRLVRFASAKDDARRRQPLATHAHNMARELDELRNRIPEHGFSDKRLENMLEGAERQIKRIRDHLSDAV